MSPHSASKPRLVSFAVALLLLFLWVAPLQARTRPHYGGQIRVATSGDPMQRLRAWQLALEGLTRIDGLGNPQPSLSDRWTSDENHTRWQFHLRAGVSFHNGTPLTAATVVASLTESCRPAPCPWPANGLHVVGSSVIITTSMPTPELAALLAQDRFRIEASTALGSGETSPDEKLPIGTGPFRFMHIATGSVTLTANEESWQGRPFLDAIELIARPSNAGSDSHSYDLAPLSPTELRQAVLQHAATLTQPSATLLYLEIRETSLNPQLRAAAALALDRAALQQVIFQKQAEVTASLLPNAVSGYSFLFPSARDLNRAQILRAGVTPPALTIAADSTETMQLAAARIALNLHDAGFSVRVLPALKESAVTPSLAPRLPNADLTLRTLTIPAGASDLALNAILHQLGDPTVVPAGAPAADYQAEREFLDRHTILPLLLLPRAWAVSPRLRDIRLNFDGCPDLANASLQAAGDAP